MGRQIVVKEQQHSAIGLLVSTENTDILSYFLCNISHSNKFCLRFGVAAFCFCERDIGWHRRILPFHAMRRTDKKPQFFWKGCSALWVGHEWLSGWPDRSGAVDLQSVWQLWVSYKRVASGQPIGKKLCWAALLNFDFFAPFFFSSPCCVGRLSRLSNVKPTGHTIIVNK